ncbi:MAG: FtsQ-type POTRA domain-containing protein [Alphaproteobacteria bacterium]|nr:FtsQ-type POTRA domain-containing protein [Alphaproteobacteria bacterium]
MRAVRKEPSFSTPRRRRKPRSGPAPARRRAFLAADEEPRRSAGKRKSRKQDTLIGRWRVWYETTFKRYLSMSAVALIVLGGAGVYGLFAGGHVARASEAVMASVYGAMGEAGLRVEHLTLHGRNHASREAIEAAIGLKPGDPILAFDPVAARERLMAVDFVADARVVRQLPNRITVTITEETPFAIWQYKGQLHLISEGGDVISAKGIEQFHDLPMVVGKNAHLAAGGLEALLAQHPAIASEVSAAVYVNSRRWDLHMKSDILVMLPSDKVKAALVKLERLIREQHVLQRAVSVIDMRLPDRTVFRPIGGVTIGGKGERT